MQATTEIIIPKNKLIQTLERYLNHSHLEEVSGVLDFAILCHEGQTRKSGGSNKETRRVKHGNLGGDAESAE